MDILRSKDGAPIIRIVFVVLLYVFWAAGESSAADDPVNVLRLSSAKLASVGDSRTDRKSFAALTDDDPSTVTATTSTDDSLTVVYGFGGGTVAIKKLVINLPGHSGDAAPPAQFDLLVSMLSPHAGFQSVRSDPLKPTSKPQSFSFAPIGAKWIMLRFTPGKKGKRLAVAEVAVMGNSGLPVTRYKFKESPANAFDVLQRLKKFSSLDVALSKDETSLFADAKDGKLDDWSFAEAALISSGLRDAQKRKPYATQLDSIETKARKAVAGLGTPFEKGQALLKFLHAGPLANGYKGRQTDLAVILDKGKFNCVSSATLFNIIGRRLGLDCRAVEVPNHAFSIVYDGTKHADVETTTAGGFNPSRNRRAQEEFTKLTGFAYIPDSNRDKRREIGTVGLIAITYYNHGVELSRNKRYHEALVAYFRAMSLDPEFDSSVKNALAVLANWSLDLSRQKKFAEALNVLATGLDLAPKDASLVNNHKVVWRNWGDMLIEEGRSQEALDVFRRAAKAVPKGNFEKMQSWVFIQPGEKHAKAGDWEKALAVVKPGLKALDAVPRKELEQWVVGAYHRWARYEQKQGHFDKAVDVVEKAMSRKSGDGEFANHLAFLVQEWLKETYAKQGAQQAEDLLARLLKRFAGSQDIHKIAAAHAVRVVKSLSDKRKYAEALTQAQRIAALLKDEKIALRLSRVVYDQWTSNLVRQKDWQKAVDVYTKGLKRFPDDPHLKNNLNATWDQWAGSFIKCKDFAGVLDVYEKALPQHPDPRRIETNILYFVQEWTRQTYKNKGGAAADAVLAAQVKRFSKVPKIRSIVKGHYQRIVQDLIRKEKYRDAYSTVERSKALLDAKQDVANLAHIVCDSEADSFVKKKEWQKAVDVYAKGLKKFPKDGHLKQNAVATWYRWAKTYMDTKDWANAIKVYQRSVKMFPDNKTLINNLKFCRQQLEKSK